MSQVADRNILTPCPHLDAFRPSVHNKTMSVFIENDLKTLLKVDTNENSCKSALVWTVKLKGIEMKMLTSSAPSVLYPGFPLHCTILLGFNIILLNYIDILIAKFYIIMICVS